MKKQPLTDMSGRWVLSTFEAFDTLLSRGYVAASPGSYSRKTKYLVIDNEGIHRYSDEVSLSIRFSEAYYHKGHFYDEPQDDTITEDKVPLTDMEGRWWEQSEEAFKAAKKMGYEEEGNRRPRSEWDVLSNGMICDYIDLPSRFECYIGKQAYYHKGHFYDEPQDEWLTEVKQ